MAALHPRAFALLRVLVREPGSISRNRYFSLFEDRDARMIRARAALLRRVCDEVMAGVELVDLVVEGERFRLSLARGSEGLDAGIFRWETVLSREELSLLEEVLALEVSDLGDSSVVEFLRCLRGVLGLGIG